MRHVPLAEHRLRIAALVCGISFWVFFLSIASHHIAKDFPQFYVLGRLAFEGRADDLQNGPVLSQEVTRMVSPTIQWTLLPIYGPQVALFLLPLGALRYTMAQTVWLIVSTVLYAMAVWRLLKDCPALHRHAVTVWLLAGAAPALFQLVWYGQLSMLALLFLVLGLSAWEHGQPFLAGLAFGMLVYKPQYGIALGFIFLLTRAYPVIAGALVTGVGQLVVACVYGGTDLMVRYFRTLLSAPSSLDILQSKQHLMQSILPITQTLPSPSWVLPAYAALSVAILAMTYRVWVRASSIRLRQTAVVLCGLLISPHLYVYDLVLLTPIFFWLMDWVMGQEARTLKSWRITSWCLVGLYLWPVAGLVLTYNVSFNGGPFIMLWVFGWVAWTSLGREAPTVESMRATPA